MARRRKSKVRKPSVASSHGITKRSYESLKREASNTRRRIANIVNRAGKETGYLPDAEDYKLNNLLRRIDSGEKVKDILKEMTKINFESFQKVDEQPLFRSKYGHYVDRTDRERLIKAVNTANRNIDKATRRYADFADIMPQKFNVEKILEETTSDQSIRNQLAGLKQFTASKLVPNMIEGVFTTQAEYNYLTDIINRENKRREERQVPPQEGYLITQAGYDSKPIDISKLVDINAIRRKATQFDDPARTDRANHYLDIYKETLDRAEATLADAGYGGKAVAKRFNEIREVINSLYNNAEIVTQISNHMPDIDIRIISDLIMGDIEFNTVYEDWMSYKSKLNV